MELHTLLFFGDRYDTSLAPLASPCLVLSLIGVETEGFLDYQGRAGIISIVRWNLRPVIFGVDSWLPAQQKEHIAEKDLIKSSDWCPAGGMMEFGDPAISLSYTQSRGQCELPRTVRLSGVSSETRFYTTPPLEGKIATDTLSPSPAPVVYKLVSFQSPVRGVSHKFENCSKRLQQSSFKMFWGT